MSKESCRMRRAMGEWSGVRRQRCAAAAMCGAMEKREKGGDAAMVQARERRRMNRKRKKVEIETKAK